MIRQRTNAAASQAGSECAGCAALRTRYETDMARLEKQLLATRREIADLQLLAELGMDNEPRPPGVWVTAKQAADASGYDVSGIWGKVRSGKLRKWKRGGRVVVDISELLHKNKKTPCVFSAPAASTSSHLEEAKIVDDSGSIEIPARSG